VGGVYWRLSRKSKAAEGRRIRTVIDYVRYNIGKGVEGNEEEGFLGGRSRQIQGEAGKKCILNSGMYVQERIETREIPEER